jgi:mannosyltransferase
VTQVELKDIRVIAPNFKKRLSGVTSTIIQLVPVQNRLGQKVATLGPGLPENLPHIRFRDLWRLWQQAPGGGPRVWHARRNLEMLPGIFMRDVLRMKVKLVFTSAAQRKHSAYTRKLIAQMDEVVATSAKSGSFLEVPHTVIMHGVDTELFHPPKSNDDTIEATGLPGKYLVGCFGRVRHQKGTDLFVQAMIALLPSYPDWTAVISGRVTPEHKSFADKLKADIDAAGLSKRIVFLGEVDDIKPWYRRLTLYVAPSRNEGFGLTPLEAMSSQTAVVTSDAGAYAEMVLAGETGTVVAAGDGDALRNAIKNRLENPAETLEWGETGRSHMLNTFELQGEARALQNIYERVAQQGGHPNGRR